MPRDGSDVMSKVAGTTAVPNAIIESGKYNATIDDIIQDLNTARPISAGGTGSTTKIGAANALEVISFGAAQTLTTIQKDQALGNLGISADVVLTTGAQDLSGKVFVDASDVSKKLAFTLSGISTATTRTVTWPDASGTVMLTTQYAVLTELQTLGVGSDGEYLKNTGGALDWAAIPSTATSKRIYTSSDTWSKPTGLVKIVVTVIGAGGGGGGAANASSGNYHYGGPGAGGGIAVSEVVAASLGSTETVTIGAGGTAGSTGGGDGGTGGTTSFGAHAVATGGAGGDGENAGTGTSATRNTEVAAGVGTTGNIYVGYGSKGNSEGALYSGIRYGGASAISFGLRQTNTTTSDTAANSPANTGTGGIGGCNIGNTGGRVGGVGGSGLVIVEEYFA